MFVVSTVAIAVDVAVATATVECLLMLMLMLLLQLPLRCEYTNILAIYLFMYVILGAVCNSFRAYSRGKLATGFEAKQSYCNPLREIAKITKIILPEEPGHYHLIGGLLCILFLVNPKDIPQNPLHYFSIIFWHLFERKIHVSGIDLPGWPLGLSTNPCCNTIFQLLRRHVKFVVSACIFTLTPLSLECRLCLGLCVGHCCVCC